MYNKLSGFFASLILFTSINATADELPKVDVYKSPSCSCCSKWADHLTNHGFSVTTHNEGNMSAIKKKFGVPATKASCHTATIGDYIIEGHIPAENILDLLEKKLPVTGITVPGMPLGSPGMEAPQGQPYTVYTFDKEGNTEAFAEHSP